MSDSMHQRIAELDAERGTIYSEDGQMLSTSIPQFDIYIDFLADGLREKNGKIFKENIDSFSIALSNFLGIKSAAAYKKELRTGIQKEKRYYPFKKKFNLKNIKYSGISIGKIGKE